MKSTQPRVLWLINHSTLRAFEVPLLISLGIEVYTSKLYPRHQAAFRSASADSSFDASLTIPEGDLARLNAHDFYQRPLFPAVRAIVNRHFDAAICGFFPEMIQEFVNDFDGFLFLRAFGLAANDPTPRYSTGCAWAHFWTGLRGWASGSALQRLFDDTRSRARCVSPCGRSICLWAARRDLEAAGLLDRRTAGDTVFLPQYQRCAKYYGAIYREFIGAFEDLPHIIGGEQRIPVDDPAVRGFRPREEILRDYRECAVMFYHSTERRHLHYHPLEAIVYGMPLVFMRQGYLGFSILRNPAPAIPFPRHAERSSGYSVVIVS